MKKKPDPVPEMKVVWITPSIDNPAMRFIQNSLIDRYGKEEMVVARVFSSKVGLLVYLKRDGKLLRTSLVYTPTLKSGKSTESPLLVNWDYLRPVK